MLDDYPKRIILKDHSECSFHTEWGHDKKGLEDFFKRVSTDDLWVLKRDYTQPESLDKFLQSLENQEGIRLFAYQNGKIIGMGGIQYTRFGAYKNIGEVEILIDEDYKKNRLGTWIILELISLASSLHLELLRIELIAGKDDPAIIASRRLNFTPQATLKNYLRDRKGRFVDLVILIKEIAEEWSDF